MRNTDFKNIEYGILDPESDPYRVNGMLNKSQKYEVGTMLGQTGNTGYYEHNSITLTKSLTKQERKNAKKKTTKKPQAPMITPEAAQAIMRGRFEKFDELRLKLGYNKAIETIEKEFAKRIFDKLTPLFKGLSLIEGWERTVPMFEASGMIMSTIDIQTKENTEGLLEIQKKCIWVKLSKEFGHDKPCHLICDMEVRAISTAFKDIEGRVLARIADGDSICCFKYEKTVKKPAKQAPKKTAKRAVRRTSRKTPPRLNGR